MPASTPSDGVQCRSGLDNDLPYEACLSYCTMAAHCVKCKCKACGLCKAKSPPSPPMPPPPVVYAHTRSPTADALGCIFEYNVDRFDIRSFKAEVIVNRWSQGGKVLVDFGPIDVTISGSWGADAARIPGKNGYVFVMRHAPEVRGHEHLYRTFRPQAEDPKREATGDERLLGAKEAQRRLERMRK